MLVNYKGRPWMKGATENPALLYSLAALVAAVVVRNSSVHVEVKKKKSFSCCSLHSVRTRRCSTRWQLSSHMLWCAAV